MGTTRTMVRNADAERMVRCYREGLARIDVAEQADPRTHRFFHGYVAGLRDMGVGLFGQAAWDQMLLDDAARMSLFVLEAEAAEQGPDRLLSFMWA